MATKRRIVRFGIFRAGMVSAAVHGFLALLCGPFVVLAAKPGKVAATIGVLVAVPLAGFLWGILAAAIYNLAARWTGGFEVTVADVDADKAKP